MNYYLLAVVVIITFMAVASLVFIRAAPVILRVGAVALVIVGVLWLYWYISSKPPPLAGRVLEIIKAKGPVSARGMAQELGVDYRQIERTLNYLVERGLVRRYVRDSEEYYDAV
ncbi:MAG: MarR family transcriptional regulator [Thermoproteaceae archaeon]|jgi:DNA-binding transcriptional ArsR family regulator|nr:MarR family transcriptional regulator [Thermoproteaceae archaeon]